MPPRLTELAQVGAAAKLGADGGRLRFESGRSIYGAVRAIRWNVTRSPAIASRGVCF
jgi:hypothetical protein